MAHPRLPALDRTLVTAGATAVLAALPLTAAAGADAPEPPAVTAPTAEDPAAPVKQSAAPVAKPAAPIPQTAVGAAPETGVQTSPSPLPPADDPVRDLAATAEQAAPAAGQAAAAAQQTVEGLVGGPPAQPAPGAPMPQRPGPGGPAAPNPGGPAGQGNQSAPTAATMTNPSPVASAAGAVTPVGGPGGGWPQPAALTFGAGGGLWTGLGTGSGPLLQPLPAPLVSIPSVARVPQVAERVLTEAPAASLVHATPLEGAVAADRPAWLLTTAAGLLLLVGAGHVIRARGQVGAS